MGLSSYQRYSFVGWLALFAILMPTTWAVSEFFPHAQSLSNNGVIRLQSSETGYRLWATITRAEAVKLALSSAWVAQKSCNTTSSNSFIDVTSSLGDLCGYIEGAVQNRIIGTSSRFYPNTPITRWDFASAIIKAFDVSYPNLISTSGEGTLYYTDVPSSLPGANSINRLATTGCINTNLTNFRPYASITRGEAFKIMACMMKKKEGITVANPTINTLPSLDCSTFYWKDATHTTCQPVKQFCGAYMYQGLQTFETEQACMNSSTTNQSTSYAWSTTSYGACSKTCGEGIQSRTVSCKRTTDNVVVADSYCSATGIVKPVSQKLCNVQSCGGNTTTQNTNPNNLPSTPNTTPPSSWPFSEPDPGYGLWVPPGTQKLYVADAAFLFANGNTLYVNVPGCLNTRPSPGYDKCRRTSKYIDGKGVEIKYLKNDIIAIRVTGVTYNGIDVLQRAAPDGGNYVGGEDISISEIPGDFNVATGCVIRNTGFNGVSWWIRMSNGDSYTQSAVACSGNGCQSGIGTTYKNQTLSNGTTIRYIWTNTGVISVSTYPTCKIVPGKKYYVNLKNVSPNPENLYNSLLLWFNVAYWGHLSKPTGSSYSGRWKYYATSSGAASEYGAHYIPWTTMFYGQGNINGGGGITTRYKRQPLSANNGDECTGIYWASSNTWYEGMYSGAKLVCEPGAPNRYGYWPVQSMGTQDVSLNDYNGFQGYAGGDTVQVRLSNSTATQTHTLQWSGKPMTIADVQASIVNDFGSSCSAVANMQNTPYKEWTLSPRNPRNCVQDTSGVTVCTFTSEVVRSYCNLVSPAPANTAEDAQAARNPNPLPYPFFIGNTDPVTGN